MTERAILARSLHEAINALEHRQAVSVSNILNWRILYVNLLRQGRLKWKHTRRQDPKNAVRKLIKLSARTSRIVTLKMRAGGRKAFKVVVSFVVLVTYSNDAWTMTLVGSISVLELKHPTARNELSTMGHRFPFCISSWSLLYTIQNHQAPCSTSCSRQAR